MTHGILIAAMEFSNVAEDEFNDWYDTEHIPERQRVPGFLVCQSRSYLPLTTSELGTPFKLKRLGIMGSRSTKLHTAAGPIGSTY